MTAPTDFSDGTGAQYVNALHDRVAALADGVERADAAVDYALCLLRMGRLSEATLQIDAVALMAERATRGSHQPLAALAMFASGMKAFYMGAIHSAITQLLNASEAARMCQLDAIRSRALAALAFCCTRLGAYRDGLDYAKQAIEIGAQAKSARAIAQANVALGNLHNDRDEVIHAKVAFDAAYALRDELGDPFLRASVMLNCAVVATTFAEQSARDPAAHGITADEQALRVAAARAAGDACMANCIALHDRLLLITATWISAQLHQLEGDLAAAIETIDVAISRARAQDARDRLAIALMMKGRFQMATQNFTGALATFTLGEQVAREVGSVNAIAQIALEQARCYEATKDYAAALVAMKVHTEGIATQRRSDRENMETLESARDSAKDSAAEVSR